MKKKKFLQVLIAAIFVLGAFGFAAPQQAAIAKAQPQLQELAAQDPDQLVRVIAQKIAGTQGVEAMVARLGGKVVVDLSIINAFAAEMPAEAALELARAEGVRWVSLDAPTESAGKPTPNEPSSIPTTNFFLDTMRVRNVWSMGLTGDGIGVAVVDSGINNDADFTYNPKPQSFATNSVNVNDIYGHGTHVAGIIAGNGKDSNGLYKGVAPGVKLYNLKIADGNGMAYESDVVAGLQWVYQNKATYNIRVVNLSLNTTTEQSYHVSPLDAACEILWFNGVVVVVSSGNKGNSTYNTANASPANDPFIISVGAADEKGTSSIGDDDLAPYTAWGTTMDGYFVPSILAPGSNIYSVLSSSSDWDILYPERTTSDGQYFRISGTSMAAPMVTGAVALLLQDEPNLTPDQVKYRLANTSRTITIVKGTGKNTVYTYFPYLDVYSFVTGTTTQSANQGIFPSRLLSTGSDPIAWGSVGWNSVGWNSVGWNSVGWNSVGWNSVGWNSTYWGQ